VLDFVDPVRAGRNFGSARRDAGFERIFTHAPKIGGGPQKCELLMELFRRSVHVGTCRELERFYAVIFPPDFGGGKDGKNQDFQH
jgi:hypothetical protein